MLCAMNASQRVALTMRHQPPDRVSVMCQIALGHYFVHGHHAPPEVWFDSEIFVRTLARFQRQYRFDGFLVNLPGRPANWRDYLDEQRGDRLYWRFGLETWMPTDDNAHTFAPGDQPLPRADYERVDPDDPATYRIAGYLWNTWHAPTLWDIPPDADLADAAVYPDWATRGLRIARDANPDVSVHAEVFSPFTHLLELFGYEQAMMAIVDAPELCHRLLSIFAQHVTAQVKCQGACDPDAILISSAFAGGGFIGRDMYGEFVVPYEKQVANAIAALDVPSYTHTCGAIGDRLDLMADTDG